MAQGRFSLKRFRCTTDRFMRTRLLAFLSDSASRGNGRKLWRSRSCRWRRRAGRCRGGRRSARRQTRKRTRRAGCTLLRGRCKSRGRLACPERHHRQRHAQSKEGNAQADGCPRQRARCTARREQPAKARATAAHAESSTFGALQQHDEDQPYRDEEVNDSEYRLHRLPVPGFWDAGDIDVPRPGVNRRNRHQGKQKSASAT